MKKAHGKQTAGGNCVIVTAPRFEKVLSRTDSPEEWESVIEKGRRQKDGIGRNESKSE